MKKATAKVDASLKKYDRYVKTWPESEQAQIVWRIAKARLLFQTHLLYRSDPLKAYGDKELEDGTTAAQEARDRFMKYKNKKI